MRQVIAVLAAFACFLAGAVLYNWLGLVIAGIGAVILWRVFR